jgi:hypothetical protein
VTCFLASRLMTVSTLQNHSPLPCGQLNSLHPLPPPASSHVTAGHLLRPRTKHGISCASGHKLNQTIVINGSSLKKNFSAQCFIASSFDSRLAQHSLYRMAIPRRVTSKPTSRVVLSFDATPVPVMNFGLPSLEVDLGTDSFLIAGGDCLACREDPT